MPKENIDYSNTIIYKIYCNDKNINDVYVGHTTNFIKRKHLHKVASTNLNNKLKIYNIIREHGGWDNWIMIEIAKYNCKDKTEARIKEQEHYNELNSSLNSCPPYVDKNKYFCSTCDINCITKKVYENHINCNRHKNKIQFDNDNDDNKKSEKSDIKFHCENCDYICYRKYDFGKHILTSKHKKLQNSTEKSEKSENIFTCLNCKKIFKDRTGLWRHKKKCEKIENNEANNICESFNISPEIILNVIQQNQEFKDMLIEQNKQNHELQKQNNELQKQILEVCKNGIINNNTNINSHNKTFNLQLFLNETCKDAMNIMDFVDSIKIQLSDIESIGQLGFVNGISKLIIKNLKALDENMRPVHCSDPKRDSLYVKDANVWEKEDPENKKIKKAIKYISHKNICAIPEWKAKYPDCIYSDSKKSDQYNHIIIEAMGGSGDNDAEKADKIVKKIAKEVTIDK
jgi:hypothetical protein